VPRTARITNQFGTKEVTTGNATRILVASAKRHCARFRAQGLGIPVVTTSSGRILARIASIELVPYRRNPRAACPD